METKEITLTALAKTKAYLIYIPSYLVILVRKIRNGYSHARDKGVR